MRTLVAAQGHTALSPSVLLLPAAVGGDIGGTFADTVEAFNGTSWSAAASMPTARSFVGVGVLGTVLYGEYTSGHCTRALQAAAMQMRDATLPPIRSRAPDTGGYQGSAEHRT